MKLIEIILIVGIWFYVGWVIGYSERREKRQKKSINRSGKWVSMKERMPSVAEWMNCESEFLVSTKDEVYHCSFDACTNKFVCDNVDGEILAWMPIPEPYEPDN